MYASATKNIGVNNAIKMAEEIIEKVMAEVNDRPYCHCHGACGCEARYWSAGIDHKEGVVRYSPDWTGTKISLRFVEDCLVICGNTSGGNYHELEIDLRTGLLTASHDGARRSSCGLIGDFLPESFWNENQEGWKLVDYKTSEPTWSATIALLRQKFGDGPTTLEEADHMKAKAELERIKDLCRQIGKELPSNMCAGYNSGKIEFYEEKQEGFFRTLSPLLLRFSAVDYRRAAAVGVKLP